MEGLLDLMEGWSPLGQGVFLLLIAAGVLSVIERFLHYFTVILRGWPEDGESPTEVIVEGEGDELVVEDHPRV